MLNKTEQSIMDNLTKKGRYTFNTGGGRKPHYGAREFNAAKPIQDLHITGPNTLSEPHNL